MHRPALHPRPSTPDEIVETFLAAYRAGIFPMAELPEPTARAGRAGRFPAAHIGWYSPDPRAVLPLSDNALHVGRTLARTLRRAAFTLTSDHAFERVIRACAAPAPHRGGPWLDETLIRCYTLLHLRGHAHSIEVWRSGIGLPADVRAAAARVTERPPEACVAPNSSDLSPPDLLGGIYGVSIGAAFFAESMFSSREAGGSGASSAALITLWHHLRRSGYQLFDVQIANDHTRRFGVIEIPRASYVKQLAEAIDQPDGWRQLDAQGLE